MNKHLRTALFTLAGMLAGYLYYVFVGCAGSCPIAASPWRTVLYVGAVGLLLAIATGKEDTCNT